MLVGEIYAVKHHEHIRFWYWSNMSPKEAILLQTFDSLDQFGVLMPHLLWLR